MKTPDPHAFRSGRLFAAWLGLTPKDHSTAGKTRLGKITRAGDERLRQLLVVGATFTSFDFPGATQTSAYGINSAGQVVGKYSDPDGSTHGFLAEPAQKGKPQ